MAFDDELSALVSSGASPAEIVRVLDESNARRPQLLMRSLQHSTGDKVTADLVTVGSGEGSLTVWDMYERIFIAALDLNHLKTARDALNALVKKFPKSKRVFRLSLTYYEVEEPLKALEEYSKLREKDPTDFETWKREISTLKRLCRTNEAIACLQQYLKVFSGDKDAWNELAILYLNLNEYNGAKFALEELILLDPRDYFVMIRYAEVLCTLDMDKYAITAREYYCMALESNQLELRALYGLLHCTKYLSKSKEQLNVELDKWAKDKLIKAYSCSPLADFIQKAIK